MLLIRSAVCTLGNVTSSSHINETNYEYVYMVFFNVATPIYSLMWGTTKAIQIKLRTPKIDYAERFTLKEGIRGLSIFPP